MDLSERLTAILRLDPAAPAVEHDGAWTTWGDLAAVAGQVGDCLERSGAVAPVAAAVVLANLPETVGAAIGILQAGGCLVTVNPHQGDVGLAADVAALRPPVVVASEGDWCRPGLVDACREVGAAGIEVTGRPDPGARLISGLGTTGPGEHRAVPAGVAIEMLTSGTTGPAKRVPLAYAAFERTIDAAGRHYGSGSRGDEGLRLRSGVAVVASPLVHMSGIFRVLLNLSEGRRIALLERFSVEEWCAVVRRHRPRAVSLVPAALAMVLAADVDQDVFASVEVVTSGSAALDPQLQARFEERYGVAVLPSYGATEFAGGVAGWTAALHREWIATKRGSVGRPQPGRELRVVDAGSGAALEAGRGGLLEVRSGDGPWVRTTDLARIDAEGFVWIDGRTDDAILRGGFKVFPAEVADALRAHPAVHDAGVVGLPDERLGQVPVAAVQLRDGCSASADELRAFASERLAGYKVPRRLLVVDELPRTPSLKVSGPGVRALFAAGPGAGETA